MVGFHTDTPSPVRTYHYLIDLIHLFRESSLSLSPRTCCPLCAAQNFAFPCAWPLFRFLGLHCRPMLLRALLVPACLAQASRAGSIEVLSPGGGCPTTTLRECSGHGQCDRTTRAHYDFCRCDRGYSGNACDRPDFLYACPSNCSYPRGVCSGACRGTNVSNLHQCTNAPIAPLLHHCTNCTIAPTARPSAAARGCNHMCQSLPLYASRWRVPLQRRAQRRRLRKAHRCQLHRWLLGPRRVPRRRMRVHAGLPRPVL